MIPRLLTSGLLFMSVLFIAASPSPTSPPQTTTHPATWAASDVGRLLVRDLSSYSGKYLARVAGRDTDLPPTVNGHDEFLAAWTRDIVADLHGLPVGVIRQPFATPGFRQLPASRPGVNVIVVVPGTRHPDRAVVVGAHPDGEPTSRGSAYDDTSGCMLLLGLARELGNIWRVDGLPSLTVEFVLFDAEEEGLVGSSAYSFAYRHGALMPRPVFMIDEEQSGVGYPIRPFGLLSENPAPSFAATTTAVPAHFRSVVGPAIRPDPNALALTMTRLDQARTDVFAQLRQTYGSLPYRGESAPAFAPADTQYLEIGPLPVCCSDNAPFEALGLPTVTFAGNSDYYRSRGLTWSYPFDQPDDTATALDCDTGGTPQPSLAFQAALQLPLALSLEMVQDYAPLDAGSNGAQPGVAIFSDVLEAGVRLHFHGAGSSQIAWRFGDGARASGTSVTHVYAHAGRYRLTLLSRHTTSTWLITVPGRQPVFKTHLLFTPPPRIPWHPPELQNIAGCH